MSVIRANNPGDLLPGESAVPLLNGPLTQAEQAANKERAERAAEKKTEDSYKTRQLSLAHSANRAIWTNIILTIFLAIFTAIGATAARYQGQVAKLAMESANKVSAQAAYAACVSSQISRAALIESIKTNHDTHDAAVAATYQTMASTKSEAAYIVPQIKDYTLAPDQPISISFGIKNEGKSVAKNLNLVARAVFISRDEEPDFIYPDARTAFLETPHLDAGAEPTSLQANPTIPVREDDGTMKIATLQDLKDIGEGRKDIIFFARITYTDLLGVKETLHKFCIHSLID